MNSKPVIVGMFTGVAAGVGTAMMMKNKKHSPKNMSAAKNMVGKTLRAMGDVADSVSSAMGL